MRPALPLFALLAACSFAPGAMSGDDDPAPDAGADAPTGCPAGHAGAECVLALHDQAAASCSADVVAKLRTELDARVGIGPL